VVVLQIFGTGVSGFEPRKLQLRLLPSEVVIEVISESEFMTCHVSFELSQSVRSSKKLCG